MDVLDLIGSALRWFVALAREVPPVLPIAAGAVYGFVATQRHKMHGMPLGLGKHERNRRIRRYAFLAYSIPCLLLWPVFWPWADMSAMDWYGVAVGGLLTALTLGGASLWIYAAVMQRLYAAGKIDPERWSADVIEYKQRLRQELFDHHGITVAPDMGLETITRLYQARGAERPEEPPAVTQMLSRRRGT